MNKLEYLKKGKAFVRKVVRYRRSLQRWGRGHLDNEFCRAQTENIEFAISRIDNSDKLKTFFERRESIIRFLIPSNKLKWCDELREFINTSTN
jgi:hypothetical protein